MKHLVIIGARGAGREVYLLATQMKEYGNEFDIKGFLDDKSNALDGLDGYPPILSSVEKYVTYSAVLSAILHIERYMLKKFWPRVVSLSTLYRLQPIWERI